MVKEKKTPKVVAIDPELHREIKIISANKGVKIVEYIEKALRAQVKKDSK